MRSVRLLRLAVAVAAFVAVTITPAQASNPGDVITNFQVAVSVNADSSLEIAEGITYSFNSPGHGIWRAIPLLDNLPNNKQQLYDVQVLEVLQDNTPANYEQSQDGEFVYLKIGDPNTEVTGEHTYVITYSVQGALKKLPNNDVDFYWDVIGDQWDVPILNATTDIWLPAKYLSTNCTYGPAGSLTKCKDSSEPDTLHYQVDGLLANEAMTVATQLPASAFTSFTEPTILDTPNPVAEFLAAAPKGLGLGVILIIPIIWWTRKCARETVTAPIREFVRFDIPHNLKPAEMAAAWQGGLDTRAFTATMLDLAARGIITLTLNDDEDLVITRADPTKAIAPWEKQLLDAVLGEQFSVTLTGYQERIATAVKAAETELVNAADSQGLRNPRALQRRTPSIVLAVLLFLATAATFTSFGTPSLTGIVLPAFFVAFLASLIGIFMVPAQQTEKSAEFISEVLGLKRALDTEAGSDRREYANRTGLSPVGIFATMLPFAVIFELEDAWTRQFPDLTPEQLSSYGFGFASVHSLNHGIEQTAQSLAHAMTAPSSSGSGSSGGSSGGGGGGGGGGGW